MTIGRSARCDLVLNAMFASRRHAWVWHQGDRVILEDLGSTHGTYVNGQRLARAQYLRHGDVVALGDAQLRFLQGWDSAAERTPPQGNLLPQGAQVFCAYCGAPNRSDAEQCRRCGRQLLHPDPERTQPGRSFTPTDPVIARPFPATGAATRSGSRARTWILLLLLAIIAVVLLTLLGLLAAYTLL